MSKLGRIYGEVIGNKFSFATKSYFDGDFVKIKQNDNDKESAELICEIINRGISNKFVATPQVIKYLEDNMDFEKDTIYTYSVASIGTVKKGKISQEKVSALPGKAVYSISSNVLKQVYGITDEGVRIGCLKKMSECTMSLEINKIFNPHLFVVGKTGSGKSYFMKNLISKVDEKFWLFAPSDEYNDIEQKSKIKIAQEFILEFNLESISYYLGLNASEEVILRNIKFENDIIYSYNEIIEEIYNYYRNKKKRKRQQISFDFVENEEMEENDIEIPAYGNSLIMKLKKIRHLRFSNDKKKTSIPKISTIFDMGTYTQLEQECILNYFLFRLLNKCKNTKLENRKKQLVIIEEAHNFIPSVRNTLSKEILIRLSREGRKYGISLCFITQRPRYFDQTALSQSGNKIIFALPNPDDVKHVMEEVTYYKPELALNIQSQKTGECIIIGDAYNDILEVSVRF